MRFLPRPISLRSKRLILNIPIKRKPVPAGFPSPADDYMDIGIDLNEHLIHNPASTFFLNVSGDSMTNSGIQNNDLIIVDRSLTPAPGDIVIAILNGAFTLKRLVLTQGRIYLEAGNPKYPPIDLSQYSDVHIWGVAIYSIHNLNKNTYSK